MWPNYVFHESSIILNKRKSYSKIAQSGHTDGVNAAKTDECHKQFSDFILHSALLFAGFGVTSSADQNHVC